MFDDIIKIKKEFSWKCYKCPWLGDEPLICTGECDGKVVDIIDIMCPKCNGKVRLGGSVEEISKWWDDWYEKRNGKKK